MKRLNSLFCAVAYNVLDQDAKDDDRDWEDTRARCKNAPVFTGGIAEGALFAAEHAGFGVRLFR